MKMPTYDFECQKCGEVHEVYKRFNEAKPDTVSDLELDEPCCEGNSEVKQVILQAPHFSVRAASSEIKNLVQLAERNSETLSNDHKMAIHAKNKTKRIPSSKDLPDGMVRVKTDKPMSYDDIVDKANEKREKELSMKKIHKMTDKQKAKWIKDG